MPSSAQQPRTNVSIVVAVALVLCAGVGAFGAAGPWAISLVGAAAVGSSFRALRQIAPEQRAAWSAVSCGIALLVASFTLRFTLDPWTSLDGRSLVPDLVNLPGYLLVAVGLAATIQHGRSGAGSRIDTVLDAFVAMAATFLVSWMWVYRGSGPDVDLHAAELASAMVYPPLSVAFIVLAVEVGGRLKAQRTIAMAAGIGATVLLLIGDVAFTVTDLRGASIDASWLMLPHGLAAAAVLYSTSHPTFGLLGRAQVEASSPSPRRLILSMSALCVPPIMLVLQGFQDDTDRLVVVVASLAITAAATTRVVRALFLQSRSERRLRHEASHDRLTGLVNRFGVTEHLSELAAAGLAHSVMMLDLDRFKLVNDASGHHVGDELLILVARRLQALCTPHEQVARLGGDEFVVVTTDAGDVVEATRFATRLRDDFRGEVEVAGMVVPLAISVGVTAWNPGSNPEDLIREADTAIHEAKSYGGNVVVAFNRSMSDAAIRRSDLERDLFGALARNEFELHYQPIADLATGKVTGFEALLRWNHPDRGMVPPLDFIPIAEETGLIVELGSWIIDTALTELVRWRSETAAYSSLTMSINVSARQLRDPDFLYLLQRTLTRHRVEPDAVCLELTESLMIEQGPTMERVINQIRECGVKLSIDDFGTGYSSLAYVQRYPFTCVKIDRSFVELLDDPNNEGQLVAAIIAMAEALGCTTVAEGVETLEQAQRLLELGCKTVQGYYYSRPLPAAGIPTALARLGTLQQPSIVKTA